MSNIPATVSLSKLRIYAHHGVLPQERSVGNWFEVSLSVSFPCPAVETDDIKHTINYATLAGIIRHEMATPSNLIEHVAGRIANAVCNEFPDVIEGEITITKLTPPISGIQCAGASISLIFHPA